MYLSIVPSILFLSTLFVESAADTAPSFKDALAAQVNLTSFSAMLYKNYPAFLTYVAAIDPSSPVTILCPSNAAFAKTVYYPVLGPAFSNSDIPTIRAILDYHIVSGAHPSSSLMPTFQYFPTHLTNTTYANVTGGQRVGVVLQNGGKDMIWTSGLSSRSVASVRDIPFSGGVMHILDTLLTPPQSFPATAELYSLSAEPYELTSFLGATYYTTNGTIPNVGKMLNLTHDLTIFVPNNGAMERVASSLNDMAKNDPAGFQSLLLYHIIAMPPQAGGPFYSSLFTPNTSSSPAQTLTTLSNHTISITFDSNSVFVNNARVIASDLMLSGGVMHVLDTVLSPSNVDVKPNPSLATQIPVLATTGGNFNISEAPFTTWLPDTINTSKAPAATVTRTNNPGNAGKTTTASSGAAETSVVKSAGNIVRASGRGWGGEWMVLGTIVGSMVFGEVMICI